ncbi:MAG: hypothetical protein U0Q03_07055 [Acidimicrobiales bacterium]
MTCVLLAADVDRSALDTFDLWTRFETMPRPDRLDLVGDASAVRLHVVDAAPVLPPAAITTVDDSGDARGYRAQVYLCPIDAGRCRVTLVLDPYAGPAARAAADLARFVEFVLAETLDEAIDRLLEPDRPVEVRPELG